jgi:predicted O-methyltransferase YrrM
MFKKENITRRSNLEQHDSISCYLGHGAQQNPHAYEAFYNLFNTVKPARILEIGTAMGGFTLSLKLLCNDLKLDTNILTYEINNNNYNSLREIGIDTRIENIFGDNYSQVKQEVIDYIQQDGVTIILCDGGNKIKEFNLLSNYLKPNDIIMAHDYASNQEFFNENVNMKLWNWLEIQDSDISEAVSKNNLEPFMQEQFTQAVWVCKIKK